MPENETSKIIWSETSNSNLFYILGLKTKIANLFGQKLEILNCMPKREKSKIIWSETTKSNLFYILRKKNFFGQKLEIQTPFIF